MPNLFARQTALTNVGGRIDYISNPARQEHLLAVYDGAADRVAGTYWRQLARECKAASKHATPGRQCVQGRELTIQLSNALIQRMSPDQIASKLARSFEETYGRPCMVAIHFNKTKTNLHAHLIYSERDLLQTPAEKIAPRALFFDEEGKRRYKKAEILDENGDLRPGCRIVAKGEIYERRFFGAVNQTFSHKGWLRMAKKDWLLPLRNGELKGDVEITEFDATSGKLAQQHVGKAAPAETRGRIQAYNQEVREYNRMIDTGLIPPVVAADITEKVLMAKERNQVLTALVTRLKAIHRKLQADMQQKKKEEAEKALESYRSRHKPNLDSQIQKSSMNWRVQEQLDRTQGTNYAKEDKKQYFQKKREQEGR